MSPSSGWPGLLVFRPGVDDPAGGVGGSGSNLASPQSAEPQALGRHESSIVSGEQKMMDNDLIWNVRVFVYEQFAENTRAPAVDNIAHRFDITREQASQALSTLDEKQALFLEPGTVNIRFTNPFLQFQRPSK